MFFEDFEDDGDDESDGCWQQELQRRYAQDANFMAELRARHPSSTSPPEQTTIITGQQHNNHQQQQTQFTAMNSISQNFNHVSLLASYDQQQQQQQSQQQQQQHFVQPPNHQVYNNMEQQQNYANYSSQSDGNNHHGPFGLSQVCFILR